MTGTALDLSIHSSYQTAVDAENATGGSRELALVKTKLEEAQFWALRAQQTAASRGRDLPE